MILTVIEAEPKFMLLTLKWTSGYFKKLTEESDLEAVLRADVFISAMKSTASIFFN